ncbi:extracellular solute-binding protein [Saccharothrix sp. HUAS TT1]|uniref:extracellular solute-binding protein n=1 Tax=unclassified Saccharothrix TaxID=2593673 RepID=UPI00345C3BE2
MLIVLMLAVGIAVTMVSTILVAEVDRSSSPGSVTRWVLSAVLALFSGIYVNLVLAAIVRVWRRPEAPDTTVNAVIDTARRWLRKKRRWAAIVLTIAAIVATGVALRPAPPPDLGLEEGGLVIMTAQDESTDDPRTALVNQWNEAYPDHRATVKYVAGEPDQQNAAMVNDAKPDGAHEADVYVLDIVWMEQFVKRGYVQELDGSRPVDRDDFVDKVLDTCTDDEQRLWALPFNTDVGMLYHRGDVEKPTSWADYFGPAAAALAQADGTPGVEAANAAQLADEEILTVTALEAMWAAGGEAFSAKGTVTQNEDKTAVQLDSADRSGIDLLVAASHDSDIVLTEEARSTTDNSAVTMFAEGRTMFLRNWPVAYDNLVDKAEFKVEVAEPPSASVLGGQNLAVSATTDKPRAARALIEFLTSSPSQLILAEMGGFAPTRESAYEDTGRAELGQVRTALNKARLRPVTEHYVEFSRVFREGIAHALDDPNGQLKAGFLEELAKILNR